MLFLIRNNVVSLTSHTGGNLLILHHIGIYYLNYSKGQLGQWEQMSVSQGNISQLCVGKSFVLQGGCFKPGPRGMGSTEAMCPLPSFQSPYRPQTIYSTLSSCFSPPLKLNWHLLIQQMPCSGGSSLAVGPPIHLLVTNLHLRLSQQVPLICSP